MKSVEEMAKVKGFEAGAVRQQLNEAFERKRARASIQHELSQLAEDKRVRGCDDVNDREGNEPGEPAAGNGQIRGLGFVLLQRVLTQSRYCQGLQSWRAGLEDGEKGGRPIH